MDKIKNLWNSFLTKLKEDKNFRVKTIVIGAIALIAIIGIIVLCICLGGNEQTGNVTEPTTTPPSSNPTATTTPEATLGAGDYSVTVVDAKGNPISNVIVNFMNGETVVGMQQTNENGVAIKNLPEGEYAVALTFTDSSVNLTYNTDACVVNSDNNELTITVYNALGEAYKELSAYSAVADAHINYDAYFVTVGSTMVTLDAQDRTYFIFTPEVDGIYEFSTDKGTVAIGYYGMVHYVQSNNLAEVTDIGSITSDIAPGMINTDDTGTSMLVLGLDGNGEESCVLTIERIGDHIKTIEEYPWDIYTTTSTLSPFTMPQGVTLKDFDVTASSDAYNIVFSEKDGLYHLNGEDGPVVYVKLGVESAYLASLEDVLDRSGLSSYYFDEDGNFIKKENYTECVMQYLDVMDPETGVYPLTADMIYIIQERGNYVGWWDSESPSFIFKDRNNNPIVGLNTEIAWLFLCCYGEASEEVPTEPIETEPVETYPVETQPVETEPVETEPVETKPAETEPAETKPQETKPVETEPEETEPAETKPDHKHSYTSKVKAPTCTEKGYTTYTCKCGDSYKADETKATGHNYKSVVTAPTTESKGYTTYTCKNCGDKFVSDYVDKLPAETEPKETEPTVQLGKESTADPIEVWYYEIADTMSTTAQVKAGEYAKFNFFRMFDMMITIESEDAYIVVGEGKDRKVYLPEDGVLTYVLEYVSYDVSNPCVFWIGNAGGKDANFEVKLSILPGTQNNPATLKLGDFTTKTTAGDDQGYYYIYKAEKAGKLTIAFKSININKACLISVYNLNTYTYLVETNGTITIDVNAGDEVQIVIAVADEDHQFPAATIKATASFK